MKPKLAAFTEFANQLYPHEADYLHFISRFTKEENKKILETILHKCHRPAEVKEFDPEIDKRSYSYVKKWIVESLTRADVDRFYEWILATEKQVMLDAISPAEEREIILYLKVIGPTHYCFLRFYELVQHFRDYLLIRVRNIFYRPTNIYLMEHEQAYIRCLSVNKGLNEATVGIIRHHESPELAPLEFTDFLHQLRIFASASYICIIFHISAYIFLHWTSAFYRHILTFYISAVKFHVDLAEFFFAIYVILIHLCQSGHAAVTAGFYISQ